MRVRRRRAAAAPRPPPARCRAASHALFPGPPARLEPGFRRELVPRQAKSRLPADRGGAHGFWGGGGRGPPCGVETHGCGSQSRHRVGSLY